MRDLQGELVALEREGWAGLSGGDPAAFYDRVLASHAVMVFPFWCAH